MGGEKQTLISYLLNALPSVHHYVAMNLLDYCRAFVPKYSLDLSATFQILFFFLEQKTHSKQVHH